MTNSLRNPLLGTALPANLKWLLRGADEGGGVPTKRCLNPGATLGCPGVNNSCAGGEGSICITCTYDTALFNQDCVPAGTGVPCTIVTVKNCQDRTLPLLGTQGTCQGGSCIPLNPKVSSSCGVYSTCP